MSGIEGLVTMIGNSVHSLIGQIGPSYDPLFYDVMVYIFGTMMFAVFLLAAIAFWLRKKRSRWRFSKGKMDIRAG